MAPTKVLHPFNHSNIPVSGSGLAETAYPQYSLMPMASDTFLDATLYGLLGNENV